MTILDPPSPWRVQHRTELRQRVFGLCQGYEERNDHDRLRDDLALQTATGKDQVAASSPIASFKRAPEELVLDFAALKRLTERDRLGGRSHLDSVMVARENAVGMPLATR